jgi:sugar phosphate isomerase/epimerase
VFPHQTGSGIDWLILRGETGPGARPCPLHVMKRLIGEAKAAGVPVWVEGLGHVPSCRENDAEFQDMWRQGARFQPFAGPYDRLWVLLTDPHGSDPAEWPEWARVREAPA